MTPAEALAELLSSETADPSDLDALYSGTAEAWRRRHVNSEAGATLIAALLAAGQTYRQIQERTGIPPATAHRWATPPSDADQPAT